MPSPGLTSNAAANASRFRSTWLQRNSAGEWGSTASIWRANWGRVAVRQARAHEKKKRCGPVSSSMTIAWKAWVAALAEQGLTPQTAPVIDGITGPQRFFYSWARAWRTATRPQFARQMLAIDPHSPAEFRCNQVLRNLDTFAEAFDVTPSDEMWLEPSQRVTIW